MGNDVPHDDIYKFDPETLIWTKVGRMKTKREWHAVSIVNREDVIRYCNL